MDLGIKGKKYWAFFGKNIVHETFYYAGFADELVAKKNYFVFLPSHGGAWGNESAVCVWILHLIIKNNCLKKFYIAKCFTIIFFFAIICVKMIIKEFFIGNFIRFLY